MSKSSPLAGLQAGLKRGRVNADRLKRAFMRLEARQSALVDAKAELIQEISDNDAYLERKDAVLGILNTALERAQSTAKKDFEGLLTQLLREVVPGFRDRVVLEPGVRGGRATLEFLTEDPEGNRESIFADKGGAVHNIVSTGLRFVMLARSKNRRLILLDEPDCWMSPEYVPAFVRIIEDLAEKSNTQVIYISHHPLVRSALAGQVIRLERDDDGVYSEVESAVAPAAVEGFGIGEDHLAGLSESIGWSHIRLVDFKSHRDTLIPLGKGMNYLCADNDVGKSHVIRAVDAVLNNSGTESMIRHGQFKCRVEIGLEDGMTLSWEYRKTGQRRTSYQLIDREGCVVEASLDGKDVPVWIGDYLAMDPMEGIDPHIGHQSAPVFLLDRSATGHQRAQALNLGRAGLDLQKMMTAHSHRCGEAKRIVSSCQDRLSKTKAELALYRGLSEAEQILVDVEADLDRTGQGLQELESLQGIAQCLARAECEARVLNCELPRRGVKPPEMHDLGSLMEITGQLEELSRHESLLAEVVRLDSVSPPAISMPSELPEAIEAIEVAVRYCSALETGDNQLELQHAAFSAPKFQPAKTLGERMSSLAELEALMGRLENEAIALQDQCRESDEELNALTERLGGCPFCLRTLNQCGGGHDHARA